VRVNLGSSRVAVVGVLVVALLAVLSTGAAGAPAESSAKGPRALVVKKAASPVFSKFRKLSKMRVTHTRSGKRRKTKRFDLLVLDGDELSPKRMARRKEIGRFVRRGRWVLALDVGTRHHRRALEKETGFSAASSQGGHKSDAFLFRRAPVNGSAAVIMLDARPYGALPEGLEKQELRSARMRKAQNAAQEVMRFINAGEKQLRGIAAPGDSGIPPELQHVQWSYTEQGSDQTPDAHYTEGYSDQFAFDPTPPTQHLTTNWTFTHNFNVYLDNATQHPQGDKQIVTYDLNGQVNPKSSGEPFVHMYDHFRRGTADNIQMERAWWTGVIGNTVTPDSATDGKLLWQGSEPQNPNSETSYTSGQDFTVEFEGSNEGAGINASYGVHNEQSHTVQDWGVENKGSQNNLSWTFSARHPCDARPEHYDEIQCFNVGPSIATPTEPNDLSRGQMQVATSARWNTRSVLDGADGQLNFSVTNPITVEDTVCTTWVFLTFACNIGGREINRHSTGPSPQTYSIDASVVNPIPIKSLTFSPAQANGTKGETVTGTVTLEQKTGTDTNIVMYSDSRNAPLGVPSAGFSSKVITVPKGQDSATFETTTNDNTLNPGQHTTANITAFYADSFTKPLRICAGNPPC
jgi:hypothetical protein